MGVGIQPLVIPAIIDHSTASSVFQVHMIHPDCLSALLHSHCISEGFEGDERGAQLAHRHMSEFRMISLETPYSPN